MVRDVQLTMSNKQSLSLLADTELSDTDSASTVPGTGESGFTPSGGLVWHVIAKEATGTPIQVEGKLLARLLFSKDGGSTWETDQEQEMEIAATPGTPDPCLPASGKAVASSVVGRNFPAMGEPPTDIRYKTIYSTSGRTTSDGAATVEVTSYLAGPGEF